MSVAAPTMSPSEAGRTERLNALAGEGPKGIAQLVEAIADPSWSVRRVVIDTLARQGEPAVCPLCDALVLKRENEAQVAGVVDALVQSTGDVESVLLGLATHSNPAVVYDVAQVLGRRRSGLGVGMLTRLTTHEDDNVAVAAIEALGRIGGSQAVTALVAAASGGNFFRTFPAIDVLGRSGDPAAVPALLQLVDQPIYANESIRALGHTGDERAIRKLVQFFLRPGDTLTRALALALAEIEAAQLLQFGPTHVVRDALRSAPVPASLARRVTRCMRGADATERQALCRVLGWVGGEDAVTQLLELLHDEPTIARAAADALADIGPSADRRLLEALRAGDSVQRLAILPHVGRESTALADVIACLQDPDSSVRAAACETLQRMGETSAVDALFHQLADPDLKVAQAALGAIQSLGSPRTELLTLDAARSPLPRVRRAALRIIAYFGYPSGLEALLLATQDPDERLRDVALYGLPYLSGASALDALLAAASHEAPRTRAAAMRALGQTGAPPRVLAALQAALKDPDPWVRYYAVQSLGKLRVREATPAVMALLEDPAGHVRVAVVDALAYLNTDEAAAALVAATSSVDPDVRRSAFLGLGMTRRPEALERLVAALHVSEPATRLVVASAVAEFDAPQVLPALVALAQDPDASVRNAAVGFVAARPEPEATRALVGLLSDLSLQEQVLHALAQPLDGRVAGLLAGLKNADERLAPLLIRALARMRRPEAVSGLFEALRAASAAGRKAAAGAVASLGTAAARLELERAAREDASEDVRRLCSLALVA